MVSKKKKKARKAAYEDLSSQAQAAGLDVDLSGFKEGGQYKARNAALKAALGDIEPEVTPEEEAPVEEPGMTPMDVNTNVTNAIGAVTPAVAQDVAAGLGFRQDMRGLIGGEIAGMGPEGLSEQDLADIAAVRDQRMSDVTSDFRSRVQNVVGGMKGRGFSSSNLMQRGLDSGAYKAFDRNMQGVQAQEAQMRQEILNARAGRRAQRINSALGATNVFGSRGVNDLQGTYINPNVYGGISQRDAATMLPGIAGQGGGLWSSQGTAGAQIASQPRTIGM